MLLSPALEKDFHRKGCPMSKSVSARKKKITVFPKLFVKILNPIGFISQKKLLVGSLGSMPTFEPLGRTYRISTKLVFGYVSPLSQPLIPSSLTIMITGSGMCDLYLPFSSK